MKTLEICLTPSQSEFVSLECRHPLFVGGPGCGKSYIIGLVAAMYVQHSKEAHIYIYAPENHHIRTIEVPNVLHWLNKFGIKNKGYNSHENMIKIETPGCGNIYFKPMDNPSALVGYQSYLALIDELDTLTEEKASEIWKAVLMRNRLQPEDVAKEYRRWDEAKQRWACVNKTMAFTTPEGFNFCYKNWELRDHPEYKQVKGRTLDNPVVDSAYVEGIRERFPAHIAEAYLNGEFVNMQSVSVYFNYDPKLHDSIEVIHPGESLFIGCDFNVENTSATVYVKRNGGKEWHAVEELTGVRDAATLADLIDRQYQKKGHQITMYPDNSGINRSNANAVSLTAIDELAKKGFRIRANKKNFLIDDRVAATNAAFLKGRLFVNQRTAPTVSTCFVNQSFDKAGKPDKKSGYDHQNDASTYPIVFEMGPRPKIFRLDCSFVNKSD